MHMFLLQDDWNLKELTFVNVLLASETRPLAACQNSGEQVQLHV